LLDSTIHWYGGLASVTVTGIQKDSGTVAHLDEQFLQFSGLGFVTLGPFHCA